VPRAAARRRRPARAVFLPPRGVEVDIRAGYERAAALNALMVAEEYRARDGEICEYHARQATVLELKVSPMHRLPG